MNCAAGCMKSEFHHLEFISCMLTPPILKEFHAALSCSTHIGMNVCAVRDDDLQSAGEVECRGNGACRLLTTAPHSACGKSG